MNKRLCFRSLSIICLLIITFFNSFTLQAQCDDCDKPKIVYFDTNVSIPQPDNTDANISMFWYSLHWVNYFTMNKIVNKDASRDCYSCLTGNLKPSKSDSDLKSLTDYSVAPSGSIPSSMNASYILSGSASGSEGGYIITLSLEASVTREVLKQATYTFSSLSQQVSLSEITDNLASQFPSLIRIIRDFEKKKRDSNTDIALRADKIELTPQKKTVKPGEEVTIKFNYKDCDDVPLKNRKIILTGAEILGQKQEGSTGGFFKQVSVITDESGNAEAVFKTVDGYDKAEIEVYSPYKFPYGLEASCGIGTCSIKIKRPVENLTGKISSTEITRITRKEDGKIVYNATWQATTGSPVTMNIIRMRIENLRNTKMLNRIVSQDMDYEIVNGLTSRGANDEPMIVTSSGKTQIYSKYDDKMKPEELSSYNVVSNGQDWSVNIELYRDLSKPQTDSAKAVYCLTSGFSNARLYMGGGRYKATGTTTGSRRNDYGEMENFTEEYDPKGIISVPVFNYCKPVEDETRVVVPMIINNPRALEEYLLNPDGEYTLVLNGKEVTENDYEKQERRITITLTMRPEDEKENK